MTTIIPFIPSNLVAPSFRAVFDGVDHNVIITWNVSAQRYYVNVYTSNGAWVITIPLFASPPGRAAANAVYDPFLNAVIVDLVDPSLWPCPLAGPITKPGTIIDYTLENFQPLTYNGRFRSLHINSQRFSFPIDFNPGQLVVLGQVSRYLNMIESVFQTSSMIYRNGSFEINP